MASPARCPMCHVRDWHHVADHSLPSGNYQEWRCQECGHGVMLVARSLNAPTASS
jgi:hypothetical protein